MPSGADSGRTVVEQSLEALRPIDELPEVSHWRRRVHHQHQAGGRELRDRSETVHRVIRQLRIQSRVHRVLVIGEEQRVTVGRRVRGQLAGDHARRARSVVHHDRLLEGFGEMHGERAREDVGRAALRRRRDQADRTGGVVLLRLRLSCEGEQEEEGAKAVGGFHTSSLVSIRLRKFHSPCRPSANRARP